MEQQSLKVIMFDETRRAYILVCLVCGASCECSEVGDDAEYIELDLQHYLTCALADARVKKLMN